MLRRSIAVGAAVTPALAVGALAFGFGRSSADAPAAVAGSPTVAPNFVAGASPPPTFLTVPPTLLTIPPPTFLTIPPTLLTIPPLTIVPPESTEPVQTTEPTDTTEPTGSTEPAASTEPAGTEPPQTPTTTAPPPGPGETVPPSRPLRILLSNDDGWQAPGLVAVRQALLAAGHDVVVVAPHEDQSGAGARLTLAGTMTLTQQSPDVYSVTGNPADAVEIGIDIAFGGAAPDLVVSGSNGGHGMAAATIHSGTVGAAATALNEGVPAIAVSTELNGDHGAAASLLVDLIDVLAASSNGGPVLPAGVGLNVNYPLVDPGGAPSDIVVTTSDMTFLDLDYTGVSVPGVGASTEITPSIVLTDPTDLEADHAALVGDAVSVVVITGNYDAEPPAAHDDGGGVADLADAIDAMG